MAHWTAADHASSLRDRLSSTGKGVLAATAALALPGAGVLACCIAYPARWLFRRPDRWLVVLVWTLPFHVLAMALLFGALHVPSLVVRAIAAWKELIILVLVLAVLIRSVLRSEPGVIVHGIDVVVFSLCALATIHFVIGVAIRSERFPLREEIYGFRDTALFWLLYFVGRRTARVADDDRLLFHIFVVGVVTAAAAIVERLFVPPELLVLLGVALYFQDFLGVGAFTGANAFGLPDNYWTLIGGHEVRRVGSVYLSSQAFAISFLIIMPAATLWILGRRRASRLAWAGYATMWIALLLTLTRMSIVAVVLELLIVLVLLGRFSGLVGLALAALAALVGAIVAVPGIGGFVWDTLTWQTGSSASHLKDWLNGLDAMARYPLGAGLGTADQTAVRFGLNPLGADNQFFKYGVELGVPGLLLFLVLLFLLIVTGAKLCRSGITTSHRAVGVLLISSTVGVLLNGLTTVVFTTFMFAYVYCWLAGTAVTLSRSGAAGPSAEQTS